MTLELWVTVGWLGATEEEKEVLSNESNNILLGIKKRNLKKG